MRISSLPFAVLLLSAFILSACSNGDCSVWRSSKMEVVSTQTRYGTQRSAVQAMLSLKVNGSDEEKQISEKLFSGTSRCFSGLHRSFRGAGTAQCPVAMISREGSSAHRHR
jgi:hypothetical protein